MAGNRCCVVFVGNIPYDATEEQIKGICEEVGPVVHFRLVKDRETGKPKGFGFCEYNDEETALSARRNLQGYAIKGRQLRVDFADKDKNIKTTSREHEPIGETRAVAAATVISGTLGSAQIGGRPDPLTLHLAKLSRAQLTEVVCAIKAMASQNREQARQLLLAIPNLPKALFQAQIMLGIVSPQMLLQMDLKGRASSSETCTDQRPSKLVKLNGGQAAIPSSNAPQDNLRKQQPTDQIQQLPSDVDSTFLFQQVKSLTPEQISSLPPDQQHQVIQLQQMLMCFAPGPTQHNTNDLLMPQRAGGRPVIC